MTDAQLAEIQSSIAALSTKIDGFYLDLTSSQVEFAAYVGTRFDRVEARLAAHDLRFDRVEARLDRVEGRLDRVDDRMSRLDVKVDEGFAAVDVRLRRIEGPRRRK